MQKKKQSSAENKRNSKEQFLNEETENKETIKRLKETVKFVVRTSAPHKQWHSK